MKPRAPGFLGLAFLIMACSTSQATTLPSPTPTRADRQRSDQQEGPKRGSDTLPIYQSAQINNFALIIAAFDVETIGPDSNTVVIDVTSLFETDVPAISGLRRQQRTSFGVRRLDPNRTFLDRASSYPLNVDVRHSLTFEATQPPSDANTGDFSPEDVRYSTVRYVANMTRNAVGPSVSDPRSGSAQAPLCAAAQHRPRRPARLCPNRARMHLNVR
jgi:hypothetical protein